MHHRPPQGVRKRGSTAGTDSSHGCTVVCSRVIQHNKDRDLVSTVPNHCNPTITYRLSHAPPPPHPHTLRTLAHRRLKGQRPTTCPALPTCIPAGAPSS